MTRSRRIAAALALAAPLLAGGAALAYNDDPDADRVFPAWLAPRASEVLPGYFAPNHLAYEIRPAGRHEAEIHFRNISNETWNFDFWFPGWQEPGGNPRMRLAPFLDTGEEARVRVRLRHGRPGMAWSPMRIHDLRRGPEDAGPARAPLDASAGPEAVDECWMPVLPAVDDAVVRRSGLLARVRTAPGGVEAAFLNPTHRDLHFAFSIPGLGPAGAAPARTRVPAGRGAIVPLPGAGASSPLALLRVVVRDLRAGADAGPTYAVDPGADLGWFPLETADGSAPLPRERLLARLSPTADGRARVRFRSRMVSPVRFRFLVPGFQGEGRENDAVTVAPGAEAEVIVALDRAADPRVSLARLRVFEVSHHDD